MGKDLKQRGDDISISTGMISSDTDLKIFIDSNKSQNQFVQKEVFTSYETSKNDSTNKTSSSS